MTVKAPRLIDSFGRVHTNLRVSVTDRCNARCFYCMPDEHVAFAPRSDVLTFEEIERFVRVAARLGVSKIRLTGGEPLVRAELPTLVEKLAAVPGIEELALTTNGMLLAQQAATLAAAGVARVNISIDTLREDVFEKITRRKGLDRVLAGIFAARESGFRKIRLNAVVIRGLNDSEIVPLGQFAREHRFELRFIEFMPLDADGNWHTDQMVTGATVRRELERAFCPLVPIERTDPSQPAVDFRFADGQGTIGFINPVSVPFCGDCNRVRLLATGKVRNCLFSTVDWDARGLIRSGASDEQLAALIVDCVQGKKAGHGIDSPDFLKPNLAMYQIGG